MSWVGSLCGGATAIGAKTVMGGIGDAAIKLREAITGDLPPEKKAELQMKLAELDRAVMEAQSSVVIAEAQGQSWLQRNWRPLLMLVIITCVGNPYILCCEFSITGEVFKKGSLS